MLVAEAFFPSGNFENNFSLHNLFQDFCYENDPDNFSIMDVINMCVTVVAYAPDSFRCVQMLVSIIVYHRSLFVETGENTNDAIFIVKL